MWIGRRPLVAALVVFALAVPAFLLLRAHSEPQYAISAPEAVTIARVDPLVQRQIAGVGYTSTRVTAFDDEQQRVAFFQGPRVVLVALVGRDRAVTQIAPGAATVGNRAANRPALLVCLALVFMLAMATVPLLSLRNLDVLAFAGLTAPIWLTGRGYVDASMLVAYPLLAYLVVRFLWIAGRGSEQQGSISLYWRLTASWSSVERRRLLRIVAVALAASTAILTVTSNGVSDVALASLAGATDLIHGTVPYGHIPSFIVHGDTYLPLNYVAYVPAAIVSPVTDVFSDPQGALILTAVAVLLTAAAIHRLIARTADPESRQDGGRLEAYEPAEVAGLRGAIAFLAFPPVLLAASSGSNDILLALCLVAVLGTVASARRSAMLLGVAAWAKLTPVVALPVWIARMDRRDALRAIAGLAGLSAVIAGGLVVLGGPGSLSTMANAVTFQFERRSLFSLLDGPGLGPLQAVAEAVLAASVVGMTLAVGRNQLLKDDPVRLAAMLAGLMLLSQLAANYWTWAYLPWVIAPAVLVLAPASGPRRIPEPAAVHSGAADSLPTRSELPISA